MLPLFLISGASSRDWNKMLPMLPDLKFQCYCFGSVLPILKNFEIFAPGNHRTWLWEKTCIQEASFFVQLLTVHCSPASYTYTKRSVRLNSCYSLGNMFGTARNKVCLLATYIFLENMLCFENFVFFFVANRACFLPRVLSLLEVFCQ